ncbi:MAG: hypothetical protein KF784_06470 [Fimbriimonadaceae bacterium]|nr:hypothetical protein [Fimbriimonadaceae bacterium]
MPLVATTLLCLLSLQTQGKTTEINAILNQPPTIAGFEKIVSTLDSGSNADRHRILLVAQKLSHDYSSYWSDLQFLSHAYGLDARTKDVYEKVRQWRLDWGRALAEAALHGDSKVREEALDVLFGELRDIDLTTSPYRANCGTGYDQTLEYAYTLGLEKIARDNPSCLKTRLSSNDYQTAYKACNVLPDPSPIRQDCLDRWLHSPKPEFRAVALHLLSDNESEYSQKVRSAMLSDPDHWVSFAALDTFFRIEDYLGTDQSLFNRMPAHARYFVVDGSPWQETNPFLAIARGDRDPMVRLASHYSTYWELESLSDSELIAGTQAYSAVMCTLCLEELERRKYPQLEAVCRRILLTDPEGCRFQALHFLGKKKVADLAVVFADWIRQVRRPYMNPNVTNALWKAFTSKQLKELAQSTDVRVRRIAFDLLTQGGFLGLDSEADILEWTYPRMKQDKNLVIRAGAKYYAPKTKHDANRETIRKLIFRATEQPEAQTKTMISKYLTSDDIQIHEFAEIAIKMLEDIKKNPPKDIGDGRASATK